MSNPIAKDRLMERLISIRLRGVKKPIVLSGYLVFDSNSEDFGFGPHVYGLNGEGKQQHFDFDDIISMKTIIRPAKS